MRVFLIGYMGCGKSSWGKKLAGKLNYDFLDMDQVIEQRVGMSIDEIFNNHGEGYFRQIETQILYSNVVKDRVVIATGGGTPCSEKNIGLIKQLGYSIYIRMDPKSLSQRLLNSSQIRPLIHGKNPENLPQFIEKHLLERELFYLQADTVVDGISLKQHTDKLVNEIIAYRK